MNNIKLVIKGFIVGLGKIVPGVSGGMLAILLGVYEDSIEAISHFFSNWKKNSIFLGMLGVGILLSIVLMSNFIDFSLEHYYLPTMLLFIGLMLGSFSSLKGEIEGTNCKKYLLHLIIPFLLMLLLQCSKTNNVFIYDGSLKSIFFLFLFGVIDAVTMVVPGVSGTAILMLFGFYDMFLETIAHLFDFEMFNATLNILLPFGLGILIGLLLTIKLVSYLLKYHSISFHYIIISFFLSSVFLLLLQTLKQNYTVSTLMISFFLFIIGYFVSKCFDSYYKE